MTDRLTIVPLSLDAANTFVAAHHRHHTAMAFHLFSIGVIDASRTLVGVHGLGGYKRSLWEMTS